MRHYVRSFEHRLFVLVVKYAANMRMVSGECDAVIFQMSGEIYIFLDLSLPPPPLPKKTGTLLGIQVCGGVADPAGAAAHPARPSLATVPGQA